MPVFNEIKPTELSENVFSEIGNRWMLLTAYDPANGRVNAMTASWGGMGVLWNRPVLFAFVRPQRYTYGLLNHSDVCSACFLEDGHRPALQICGTKSGRDTDKIAESGLTPVELDGVWGFAEAIRVMKLKKLFVADMEKDHFIDPTLLKNYSAEDYHRVFVYEIETVYEKE
ncbi:MAG: flavin reductase [Clostridia bacterium]|nr:flavin reductase [Clostridia bacterium]MBQ8382078.1 flavin reductase [Clostridia bacterium]